MMNKGLKIQPLSSQIFFDGNQTLRIQMDGHGFIIGKSGAFVIPLSIGMLIHICAY